MPEMIVKKGKTIYHGNRIYRSGQVVPKEFYTEPKLKEGYKKSIEEKPKEVKKSSEDIVDKNESSKNEDSK